MLKSIADHRKEDVPVSIKDHIPRTKPMFIKNGSVFLNWKTESKSKLDMCLEHDRQKWRFNKRITSMRDINRMFKLNFSLEKHYLELLTIHKTLSASDKLYPAISFETFFDFCERADLFDDRVDKEYVT